MLVTFLQGSQSLDVLFQLAGTCTAVLWDNGSCSRGSLWFLVDGKLFILQTRTACMALPWATAGITHVRHEKMPLSTQALRYCDINIEWSCQIRSGGVWKKCSVLFYAHLRDDTCSIAISEDWKSIKMQSEYNSQLLPCSRENAGIFCLICLCFHLCDDVHVSLPMNAPADQESFKTNPS